MNANGVKSDKEVDSIEKERELVVDQSLLGIMKVTPRSIEAAEIKFTEGEKHTTAAPTSKDVTSRSKSETSNTTLSSKFSECFN